MPMLRHAEVADRGMPPLCAGCVAKMQLNSIAPFPAWLSAFVATAFLCSFSNA